MKKIISNNKGITGIDLTIGIIVLSIFWCYNFTYGKHL